MFEPYARINRGALVAVACAVAQCGALAVLGTACKPKPPEVVLKRPDGTLLDKPPAPEHEDERQADALLSEAERLVAAGDGAAAERRRDTLLARYPGTLAAALVYESRAVAAAAAGLRDKAIKHYERLLFYRPSFERGNAAREHYAQLLTEAGRVKDAIELLEALYEGGPRNGADRLRLATKYAVALEAAGREREAVEVHVELSSAHGLSEAQRAETREHAMQLLTRGLSFVDAETLWRDVHDDSRFEFLHAPLAFKLAKIYFHVRQFRRSEEMLSLVSERFAGTPYAASARDFIDRLRARFEVDARKVGVVLPLSGRYKAYGQRSLAAIELAVGKDSPIALVVKDSEGDPNVASRAVEDLVLKDHVIAVVGPLFSKPAYAAARKAEELSVPLITLSHRDGLPQVGPYVFRTALTVKAQAEALAAVAFERLGMTRFAVLYPRTRYGTDFMQAFWNEVDRRRGELRGVESYAYNQTTYRDEVRKMVGRYHMYARPEYREAIEELRTRDLPPMRYKRTVEHLEKTLAPAVDFDAIVIPDSGRNIGLIAPALAFEDIVLTRDERTLEKIKKATGREDLNPVTLLGASTWNSPQTVESCERYCEEAVFVDAYYPDSPEPAVRDFVAAFTEQSGAMPLLSEAQAYDTVRMLAQLVTKERPADREALRQGLRAAVYEGVTGRFTFDRDGEVNKELFTLTIKDRAIKLYEGPDEGPQG